MHKFKGDVSDPETDNIIEQLHADLDESIKLSAPILWEQASGTCFKDIDMDVDCSAYHRIWQYRILWGLSNSMRPDSAFFINGLRDMASNYDFNKILISGSADYAMLAHIFWAYRTEGTQPAVTILDRCATSIMINKWYAMRAQREINSIHENLLEHIPKEKFDAILTHNFFYNFSEDIQYQVIKKWHGLLRTGGKIITQTRLRSGQSGTMHSYTEQQSCKLRDETRLAAVEHAEEHNMNPDDVASVAYEYAIRRHSYHSDNMEIYRDLFTKAGFQIEYMRIGTNNKKTGDRPSGPLSGSNGRLHIIARK